MVIFETQNELTLKVTCHGSDVIFTRAGAFIAGESQIKNYKFEKALFGPERNLGSAILGSLARRVTGENIPLMKCTLSGDSITYYASHGYHVLVYKLGMGEMISVESENLLAFTKECSYSVRFLGVGVLSQKGIATTTLRGNGDGAYVAILSNGNPIALSNTRNGNVIAVDPDAVIGWIGLDHSDPSIKADVNWKTFIGQTSGESYQFEWSPNQAVTVIMQPFERSGGIQFGID